MRRSAFWRAIVLGCFVASGLLRAQAPSRVVRCGAAEGSQRDNWGEVLEDRPFSSQAGYGYVGGVHGTVDPRTVAGGDRSWPVTWREGSMHYSFRVPSGLYRVDLGFVETDVAAPGMRSFDVLAERDVALSSVDIYRDAGDFRWLLRSVIVRVSDGWLDLKFEPSKGSRPPRVSRIAIRAHAESDGFPRAPTAPAVQGRGGLLQNIVAWRIETSGELAVGFGLFRSLRPDGPFNSLTTEPVRVGRWIDRDVLPDVDYYYKLRAYSAAGAQSEFSSSVKLRAQGLDAAKNWKRYDVRISARAGLPDAGLPGAGLFGASRGDPPMNFPGELGYYDQIFPAEIGLAQDRGSWRMRKSWVVDMSGDTYRAFGKRREVRFESIPGDWTQMRNLLSFESEKMLHLATPRVEPVLLFREGQFVGLRQDIEILDGKFRNRERLDRKGLFAKLFGFDVFRSDWEPYGERLDKGGDVVAVNYLVQQLHRLNEGEIEEFFERHFYVDRWIDRLALAAIRGELDPNPSSFAFLKDSRNGKWECFRRRSASGDWGIVDYDTELGILNPAELKRVLYPLTAIPGELLPKRHMTLLTRWFRVPALRNRYLDRVENLLTDVFRPEAMRTLIESVADRVLPLARWDPNLWPFDHGEILGTASRRIAESHDRRVAALLALVRAERDRKPEAIRIVEFLLRPLEGRPWVAVKNVSSEAVDLSNYRLSERFDQRGGSLQSAGVLQPGATVRLTLAKETHRSGGGLIALWRRGGARDTRIVLADFSFYGWQTADTSRRLSDLAANSWESVRVAAGGEEAVVSTLPGYEFLQGVELHGSGDMTIWFKPLRRNRVQRAGSSIFLRFRDEGEESFKEVALVWLPEKYRYELSLEKDDDRGRTEYYFLARSEKGLERVYPLAAPQVTYFLPMLPEIYINEVCPRPIRGASEVGEFIEIFNASKSPVSLRGMYLSDDKKVPTKWRITEDIVLPPKGYRLFYADGLNRGSHTSFKLRNSGEFLGIFGPIHEGNLRIDSIAFRGVPPGQSWGRKQDGTRGFRVWKDPTPGKRNIPKIPDRFLDKTPKR